MVLFDMPIEAKFMSLARKIRSGQALRIPRGLQYCLVLFFLFLTLHAAGQKTASRTIQVNDTLSGTCTFEYIVENNDTLRHGDYRFNSTVADSSVENGFRVTEFRGRFSRGRKDGTWIFRQGKFTRSGEVIVEDFKSRQPISGEEFRISGSFKDGIPDGRWESVRRRIEGGEVADTIKHVVAKIEMGRFTGNVEGRDRGVRFQGGFIGEWLIHGDWIFEVEGSGKREHRVYDNGVFKDHFIEIDRKRIELEHPGLYYATGTDGENWSELPMSSEIFKVLYETNIIVKGDRERKEEYEQILKSNNAVMTRALFSFGRKNGNDVWSLVGGSEVIRAPRLRVRAFPFDESEKESLKKGLQIYESVRHEIAEFLEDRTVDVGRYSYEDVAFSVEVISIYKKAVDQVGTLLVQLDHPAFLYIDRAKWVEFLSPEISYPEYVQYEFRDTLRTRSWNFPATEKRKFNSIGDLTRQLEGIASGFDETIKKVDQTLEDYKRQTFLAKIEIDIVDKRDHVIGLFSRTERSEDFNEYHAEIAEQVLDFAKGAFKEYARKSPEEKSGAADDLLGCYKDLVLLYDEVVKQPLRMNSLNELYTRTTWNPYVFTYMDEIVKERLYKAYESLVVPAIADDLRQNLSCENAGAKARNYAAAHRRMTELRETDTKLQERQIRRSPSLATVLEVFEFNLNLEAQ